MYNIIQFAQTHAHNYKTEKSIFNIITGKKSHQTFLMPVVNNSYHYIIACLT